MFGDGPLTFREFMTREPLPLATIHDAVLEFLRGRDDAVLYGAQAVNAYADESRMTQDVDIASTRAKDLAEELPQFLHERFRIAELKTDEGPVAERLHAAEADENVMEAWRELVAQEIRPEDEDAGF
jgi:hypothetical protein